MEGDEFLTTEIVVFLFEALLAGRLSREAACTLVTPWVQGDMPASPWAVNGAQMLHGFDIVRDGRFASHASVSGAGTFEFSDEWVEQRCLDWLSSVH